MIGRYGMDELYFGLFGLWFVVVIVNGLVHSAFLSLLGTAILVFMFYRFLSKNAAKRRQENAAFLKLWNPVKGWSILQRDRFRDRKNARYRKCPHCKAILKLPNRKGKHTVVCPKCHERFDVTIL